MSQRLPTCSGCLRKTKKVLNRLDVLVNNAAAASHRPGARKKSTHGRLFTRAISIPVTCRAACDLDWRSFHLRHELDCSQMMIRPNFFELRRRVPHSFNVAAATVTRIPYTQQEQAAASFPAFRAPASGRMTRPSRPCSAQLCPASRQSNQSCWRCPVGGPMGRSARASSLDGPRGEHGRNSH
jgi:hypothetical protein